MINADSQMGCGSLSCSIRPSGVAIRACVKAAGICETFQLGVCVHSSGELGIQVARMLHLGAVLPNLIFGRRRALPPSRR